MWTPAAIDFVDELPLTRIAKVDKVALRKLYRELRAVRDRITLRRVPTARPPPRPARRRRRGGGMTARRGLVILFVADVLSAVGSRISMVAIPWLVLVTTGSAARMGLVAAVEMVPYIVASIMAGPLIDSLGPRRTSILANLCSAVAVGAIAATTQLGFTALLLLVAVAGALRGAADRSKDLLVRPMAEAAEVELIRITSLHEAFARGATLLGAPLAGLLIYWTDAASVLWIDAATFAVCGAAGGGVRPPTVGGRRRGPGEVLPVARRGFSFVRRDALLATMLITTFTLTSSPARVRRSSSRCGSRTSSAPRPASA